MCIKVRDYLKQKAIEVNASQQNSNTDENILYQRFFGDFKCPDANDKDLECYFRYLGLNYRKVNYSELNVSKSKIENEIKTKPYFLNPNVKLIVIKEPDILSLKGLFARAYNFITNEKPDIYVILHKDKVNDSQKRFKLFDYKSFYSNNHDFESENANSLISNYQNMQLFLIPLLREFK